MHASEVSLVGDFHFRRDAEHLPAAIGELQLACARKKIERPDVRRFCRQLQTFLALAEFRFALLRELFLLFSLGDIRAENHDASLGRIHPGLDPPAPRGVEKFALSRFTGPHDPLGFLVKFRADRFGKNVPDHLADHFVLRPARHFGDAVVDMGVTPVAVERRERFAYAGQNGVALLDQVARFELAAARAQSGADGADQCEIAQRPRDQHHVRARAGQVADPRRNFFPACGDQERQVGPRRLLAEAFH